MWRIENEFALRLGGNTYINTPNLVVYQGKSLFQIKRSETDGMLGIDFDVYNSSGNLVAKIRKGIVVYGDSNNFEIKTGHTEYKVIEKISGRLIAHVKRRNVEDTELEVSVHLYTPDGFLFDATPFETNISNMVVKGCIFKDLNVGIVIK